MSQSASLDNLTDALASTRSAQARAADPASSVWVSANAGTGKTYVLTNRVVRLLLAGTEPAKILCLTYTKAAAAEMSKRVFDRLAGWVTASDEALAQAISELTGVVPDAPAMRRARALFTTAMETPGGLKVQTIHAFSEHLLQRFPLEAGVPPGFRILDDAQKAELVTRAIDFTIEAATAAPATALGRALQTAIRFATDDSFDELLTKAISHARWLRDASRYAERGGGREPFTVEAFLRNMLGVRAGVSLASIEAERAACLTDAGLRALRDHLSGGSNSDLKAAHALSDALANDTSQGRAAALAKYFLIGTGDMRDRLMTKPLADERPDLEQLADVAQQRFAALSMELKALTVADASSALYHLAGRVLDHYSEAKAAAGALDFDDLIERTTTLLATSDSASWVLYKLDGGIDHVLVDEAQDTSPEQWAIIDALSREFFAGIGARPDAVRTLFAVGDEKQSIYSFQGARPEQFSLMGRAFAIQAEQARAVWHEVPLNLSFRTVQAVLDAVDRVFADAARTPGLTASPEQTIRHFASRFGHAGLVEMWPVETFDDPGASDPWLPLTEPPQRFPVTRLADRIAETIEHWLASGEILPSTGKPIRAGDILILVRKRNPFAGPLVAALKWRRIPVAGADRVQLTDQVAVKDLMALGDFLTLPEDDLALATVLKSPLFGLSDEDLLAVAPRRKGSLWKAFLAHADQNLLYRPAAETLKRWRAKADFTPPFEFYANLLERDGGRSLFLHRLGPEAGNALDEFLELAITYDDKEPPSLTGFLSSLRRSGHEVKSDMEHGRDEVRVMTVHGAKGLEAPIVFLPDTCTTASGDAARTRLVELTGAALPEGLAAPVAWAVAGTSRLPQIASALVDRRAQEAEELHRLLYVAMTRARDRLYIAGFQGRRARPAGCWYNLIAEALATDLVEIRDGDRVVHRMEAPQTVPAEATDRASVSAQAPEPLPPFALRRAAQEPQLTIPLAPSRLEPYAPDAEGEPILKSDADRRDANDRPSPGRLAEGHRFLRGTITHALLQHLPTLPDAARAVAAKAFVERRGAGLTPGQRDSIVRETLAILDNTAFNKIFSTNSRAEVPIAATIPRPSGSGPALQLSGQIDRLVVTDDEVLILDYKTNRPPPLHLESVAPAYLLQLAAYALALSEIYPGRRIRAALIWTDGPRLMEVPAATLQAFTRRLWDLDPASLDAP